MGHDTPLNGPAAPHFQTRARAFARRAPGRNRIPGQRLWLSNYEIARLITERIQQLEAGKEPGVLLTESMIETKHVVLEEYRQGMLHSPGEKAQLTRTFPDGVQDVVECFQGKWTVTRVAVDGKMERPRAFEPLPSPELLVNFDPSRFQYL